MLLPQERFAFNYLYKGNFLGLLKVSSNNDIELLMKECHLKCKNGKSTKDVRESFWGHGSLGHKSIDSHIDWALERADKVWVIDWNSLLNAR